MMREFKFRAWHKAVNQMLNIRDQGYHGEVFKWLHEKQPIEIMQFTGLHDKNGNEIYEGDLLKSEGETKVQIFNGGNKVKSPYWEIKQVVFTEGALQAVIVASHNSYFGDIPSKPRPIFNPTEFLEIIGNIYENHELLTLPSTNFPASRRVVPAHSGGG